MLYSFVVLSILICASNDLVFSQYISELRCKEFIKNDVHARIENDAHIGYVSRYRNDTNINFGWGYWMGILISERFVITTAHFIRDLPASYIKFQNKVITPDFEIPVENKFISPLYTGDNKHHNVALLKLARTDKIFRFACLLAGETQQMIQTKSTMSSSPGFVQPGITFDFMEYSNECCQKINKEATEGNSCYDTINNTYSGAVLQYKICNVIYIKSVYGYDYNKYMIGHNVYSKIDWIEKTVWPEYQHCTEFCPATKEIFNESIVSDGLIMKLP